MKYYSVRRPITPGVIPNSFLRECENVVNFDRLTFCQEINREAWGYVEVLGKCDWWKKCDLVRGGNIRRRLEPGDVIKARGTIAVVDKILTQDYMDGREMGVDSHIDCEFYDVNGQYRSWMSYSDGGTVSYYDDGNLYPMLDRDAFNAYERCSDILKKSISGFENKLVYFDIKPDTRTAYLYADSRPYGDVELDNPFEDDEPFANFINYLLDNFGSVRFLCIASKVTNGRVVILKDMPRGLLSVRKMEVLRNIRAVGSPECPSKFKSRVVKLWVRFNEKNEKVMVSLTGDGGLEKYSVEDCGARVRFSCIEEDGLHYWVDIYR